MDDADGSMTLALELAALRRLDDPAGVFVDARRWSRYVGVVSERPTYVVTNYTRQHGVRQDFFSGPHGVAESLERVRDQFDTDRFVLLFERDAGRAAAETAGWEAIPVESAAEAAGWSIAASDDRSERDGTTGRTGDGSEPTGDDTAEADASGADAAADGSEDGDDDWP